MTVRLPPKWVFGISRNACSICPKYTAFHAEYIDRFQQCRIAAGENAGNRSAHPRLPLGASPEPGPIRGARAHLCQDLPRPAYVPGHAELRGAEHFGARGGQAEVGSETCKLGGASGDRLRPGASDDAG